MASIPSLNPAMPFEAACEAVVTYLKSAIPLGYWAVTRYDGTDQLYLAVRDDAYGRSAGDSHRWSDSLCQFCVRGETPEIAPDAMAEPRYAGAGVAHIIPIGAYVGVPIRRADGTVFGTICGLDPHTRSEDLTRHEGVLHLLATLLSTVLEADLARTEAARALERVELLADIDPVTGLYNRRAWERLLSLEDGRIRRFGDPVQVVIIGLDPAPAGGEPASPVLGVAGALSRSMRAADIAAQLAPDQYAVLARATPAQTAVIVERMRQALADHGVGASIGSAPYTYLSGLRGACTAAEVAMAADRRHRLTSAPQP